MLRLSKLIIPAIGITMGTILYLGFMAINESHPIENFHRIVSHEKVVPGQVINITSTVTRTKAECSSTVSRLWLDSNGNTIYNDDIERPELPAGKENFFVALHVPTNVSEGTLRLDTKIEFYCNFVQKMFHKGSVLSLPQVFFQVNSKTN